MHLGSSAAGSGSCDSVRLGSPDAPADFSVMPCIFALYQNHLHNEHARIAIFMMYHHGGSNDNIMSHRWGGRR